MSRMDVKFLLSQIFPDISDTALVEGLRYCRSKYKIREDAVMTILYADYVRRSEGGTPYYRLHNKLLLPGEAELRKSRIIDKTKITAGYDGVRRKEFEFTNFGEVVLVDIINHFHALSRSGY